MLPLPLPHTHTPPYQWQFLSRDEGEGDITSDPSWNEDEGQDALTLEMHVTP